MRVIIYGIGKRFNEIKKNTEFIKSGMIENGVRVIGVSDGNRNIWGKKVDYDGKPFDIKGIEEFLSEDIDKIIITTNLFFDEIKKELMDKGFDEKKIVSIDSLYDSYMNKVLFLERFIGKSGIEIGGPTELFSNIYKNCKFCDNVNFHENTVWWKNSTNDFRHGDKILGKFWIAEATDMQQIRNEKYDFLLSSNNLEHIANPLKALKEFYRIVKIGGDIMVLVPEKSETFDHNREYTNFEHLLEDYADNIGEDDLSHLPEIIEKHDYNMDIASGGKKKFIERAKKNIENRCLHHHVFCENSLRQMFEFIGIQHISVEKIMGNWLIIGKKDGYR